MTSVTVNISDVKASADPDAVLVTHALGSCIGVCAYDPQAGVGGMLHFQLPASAAEAGRARDNPLMYADSGFDALLALLLSLGAQKRRLQVKLAGAAQMLDDGGFFNIGRRNHASIRKVLWQHGLFIDGEDVGGAAPRNLYLDIADGSVTVKTAGNTRAL